MWADTLLHAEQQHVLRLLLWAATSVLGGTGVGVVIVMRRPKSPLLANFATQTAVWGILVGVFAGVWWNGAALRDVAGAARLEHVVWMMMGLDIGCVALGTVLAIAAWSFSRRVGGVGAGIAISVQGLALLVLDMQFANTISR